MTEPEERRDDAEKPGIVDQGDEEPGAEEPGAAPEDGLRQRLTGPAMRWTIVFTVVVVALVVAIWPRSAEPAAPPPAQSTQDAPGFDDLDVPERTLVQARADAALKPCPLPTAVDPAGAVLADVATECLGNGEVIALGPATVGRPLVVNMWATWCQPCREELPYFDEFADRAGDRLNVLAVHAKEGGDNQYLLLRFLQEVGVHLPTVLDREGRIAVALQAPRVFPSTILVDADGDVVKILPQVFDSPDEIAEVVQEHLGVTV